jgi:hypothetical protein
MQHRPPGAVIAVAGLGVVVLALIATPDAQIFVFAAWVLVLAGMAAVAYGIVLGFRHHSSLEQASARPRYLTADWVGGAHFFTLEPRSGQSEELGDPVIPAGEVAAVDGDGLARDEGRVA